jgi:hypothetical protein
MRPRISVFLAVPVLMLAGALAFACGSSHKSKLFETADSSSGSDDSSADDGGDDSGDGVGSFGDANDDVISCLGLECKVDLQCASQGKPQTTLKGTVYDPAGALGLYNIYVYIPNGPPDAIKPGNPTCTQCEAPASGSPIIGTLTDAKGNFTLAKGANDMWGVPSGSNIPIVLQAGKWRRQLTIPQVGDCAVVDLNKVFNNGSGTLQQKHNLRLPSKSSEGDMPLIAFTSGCDPAECFLRNIGIADTEFVPPDSAVGPPWPGKWPAGTGHVHFYVGQAFGTTGYSNVAGGGTVTETYQWWTDPKKLLKYDIVFNACECSPNPRDSMGGSGNPYQAMDAYLNGGGRLFATHYYGNWFFDPGTPDLKSVANWTNPAWSTGTSFPESDLIDTTFPKGKAFAQWLLNNMISPSLGNITLNDTRDDIVGQAPAGCSDMKGNCLDTQWVYHTGDNHPRYVSFNTPVGKPADKQCGRAVYSDVHLSGSSDSSTFPNECLNADPTGAYRANEKALEFLFFDLSSCVQNDAKPPPPPPPM